MKKREQWTQYWWLNEHRAKRLSLILTFMVPAGDDPETFLIPQLRACGNEPDQYRPFRCFLSYQEALDAWRAKKDAAANVG